MGNWAKSWTKFVSGSGYFHYMKLSCPNCLSSEYLKKILYGMPSEDFDYAKFAVGGCIPSNATVRCSNCEWENGQDELDNLSAQSR
jgi:hypothetical protein